jgi:hypothetical protein
MQTLPLYDDYIKVNLAPIRKALEKRTNNNGMSSEGLLMRTRNFVPVRKSSDCPGRAESPA